MIKGSEVRKADHEIEPLLVDRWSPRAMSGEEISQEELMRLFEAARWAPSSFNAQQWRALYARRGTEHWQTFFDLLVEANKVWAKNAAVLVVFVSRRFFDYNDESSVTHSYDCGAAWEISRCKAFTRVWWCTGWKDSITSARAKNFRFPMTFKWKQWPLSANRGRRKFYPKSCKHAKAPTIAASSPKAFSMGRLATVPNPRSAKSVQRQVLLKIVSQFMRRLI